MKYIAKTNLNGFFAASAHKVATYVPVDTVDGKAKYDLWSEGKELSEALHTVRSAKDFFFPQTENMARFKMEKKNIEIIQPERLEDDFAVFGVRACDCASFKILDRVFLSEPVDSYYKMRRDHAVVIGTSCSEPEETCFCSAFNIDPANPDCDVLFTTDEEGYFVEALSEKGEKYLEKVGFAFEEKDGAGCAASKAKTAEIMKKLPLASLDISSFGGGKTKEFFDMEEWESLSESCIACGTCTFVCPTCQCYDIKDFDTGAGVQRFRCWDSCMYSDFTKMAHGNIRNSQKERFRQRFMHKLVYFPENNEEIFGCVGCGRCLASCPINMNIVKVVKKLSEGEAK